VASQQVIPSDEAAEPASSFDFRSFYYTLAEKLWVILLCLAASAFLTLGYIKRAPRIYSATVVLQAAQEKPNILNVPDLQQDDWRNPEILKTQEKILQSRSLFERVIHTNRLAEDPRFIDQSLSRAVSKEQLISRLEKMVTVNLQAGTRLINVKVEHTDRALTEQIANSLVNEFMAQNYEQHSLATRGGLRSLTDAAESLKKQRKAAEDALQAYVVTTTNSVSLGADQGQSIVLQKYQEIGNNLRDAENQRRTLEGELARFEEQKGDLAGLVGTPSIANDPTVVEYKGKITDHEIDFAILKQSKLPRHPRYIMAQSKETELKNALSNATLQAAQTLRSTCDAARAYEDDLRDDLREQEARLAELGKRRSRYDELAGDVKRITDQYEVVAKRLSETAVSEGWDQNKVRIVQPAYVPDRHVKPDVKRIMLMGLMVGLLCGIGLAMGLEALDSSLKTPEQAETFLNLPLLTAIQQISAVNAGRKKLIMTDEDDSSGAEAFRTLRTTLAMLGAEGMRRTFLFTSAQPEEGKTFCALNYACSLAQQGLRTVLIEGDLRCPAIEAALSGAGSPAPGVADYLTDRAGFEAVVHATGIPNFSFIPAGMRAHNPAELLAQEGFTALIQEGLLHFDRVVVDSAPIQPVSDALLLVNRVQTVCFVVRANKTPRKAIRRAIQILQSAGAPLAGFILNGWTVTRGQHYYDYSYYPQYGEKAGVKG